VLYINETLKSGLLQQLSSNGNMFKLNHPKITVKLSRLFIIGYYKAKVFLLGEAKNAKKQRVLAS